jgi:hypothetical protein
MATIPRFGFRARVFLHDLAIKDFAVSAIGPHLPRSAAIRVWH